MRRTISIIALACACGASAQTMTVYHKGGTTTDYDVNTIDSVCFSMDAPETKEVHVGVDLGLSVMWAECNLGAETPAEYGEYYSWGELSPKTDYSENGYKFYVNEQYQDIGTNICATDYDAVHKAWGDGWRMPTLEEVEELSEKCTWTWTETKSGVGGYTVTGPNGRSIFLPAAGYNGGTSVTGAGKKGFYWTGTLSQSMSSAAHNINFSGYNGQWTASRAYGLSVRGVKKAVR